MDLRCVGQHNMCLHISLANEANFKWTANLTSDFRQE